MKLKSIFPDGRSWAAIGTRRATTMLTLGALALGLALPAQAQDGNAGVESTTKASPIQIVHALNTAFGEHHARAVHAKGIILEGSFVPAAGASGLTRAAHLQGKGEAVIVRFSDFTGIPDIPDTLADSRPRGAAIKFLMPNNQSTDIVMHSFNGFPVATTDEFRVLLESIGAAGHGNSAPLGQFLDSHPIAKTFLTTQKPMTTSWATLSFYGVNSFKFTNKAGVTHFIRYQLVPDAGEHFLTKAQAAATGPDYLQAEIKQRVAAEPIKFKLYAQVAEKGDAIENPAVAWPDARARVLLGTLTLKNMAPNTVAEDKAMFFNPNNVHDGIGLADPMLVDRARAYPVSVGIRQ